MKKNGSNYSNDERLKQEGINEQTSETKMQRGEAVIDDHYYCYYYCCCCGRIVKKTRRRKGS